jgi:hypothetical protein
MFRAYLQAKDDREGGDPTQFSFGPSLQIYRKPLIKLKKVTEFDLDDSKSRLLVLETGYRYITAPDATPETRLIEAATSNFPLNGRFLLTDRNRFDLDWKNNIFSWRYRNRLTVEGTLRSTLITSSLMSRPNPFMRVSTASGAPLLLRA